MEIDSRTVQVFCTFSDGRPPRTGSGYLLDDGLVLTAAHVIGSAGAGAVVAEPCVQFLGSDRRLRCAVTWHWYESARPARVRPDAALLRITDPDWRQPAGVPPLRWGRLVTNRTDIPVRVDGFPAAMDACDVHGTLVIRDVAQLSGTVDSGTSVKGRRYHVTVNHPPPSSPTARNSRWEGMSGAGLRCHDLLLGVVASAEPEPGWAWLSVVPTPVLLADPEFRALVGATAAEPAELQPVLEQAYVRPARSPVSLLRPESAVVRFDHERQGMIDQLREWCTGDGWFSVRLLTGPGGQGKTRLAAQLLAVMRELNWSCGFLHGRATRPGLGVVGDLTTPSLLVIDYAETRAGQLVELLEVVDRRARGSDGAGRISGAPPVRVLLLARDSGDWWEDARTDSLLLRDVGPGSVLRLADLYPDEGRSAALGTVVRDLARALADVPGYSGAGDEWLAASLRLPDVADSRFGRALDLHMAGLAALLQAVALVPVGSQGEPDEAVLLRHEQRYWKQVAVRFELDELSLTDRRRLVAVATLCVVRDATRALRTLARVTSSLPADRADDVRGRIANWLAALYPSDRDFWGPLRPDRIGEYLVGVAVADTPDLLDRLLPAAEPEESLGALQVLARVASYRPDVSVPLRAVITGNPAALGPVAVTAATTVEYPEPLRAALDTVVQEGNDDLPLLDRIYQQVPSKSQTLAVWAAELAGRITELVGAEVEAGVTGFPELAVAFNHQAYRLNEAGFPEYALSRSDMAVTLYDQLARHRPGPHEADQATAIEGHAQLLYLMGRRTEAATHAERAVDLRREQANSAQERRLLADALTGYGNHLSALGRLDEAVLITHESVELYRALPESVRESHAREFGAALMTHAIALQEVGRFDDAADAQRRAVTMFRALARSFPDVYRPDLAAALANVAEMLGEVGDPSAGLACAEESIALHEELAAALPDAHLANHAVALHCAATCLARLERWVEAARYGERSVRLFERVVAAGIGEYGLQLGIALITYAVALSECERTDDAVREGRRAIDLLDPLATDADLAVQVQLGNALRNLAEILREAGRAAEASPYSDRALALHTRSWAPPSDHHDRSWSEETSSLRLTDPVPSPTATAKRGTCGRDVESPEL